MKLLPLRDYDEHEVIGWVSLQENSGSMGCVVQPTDSGIQISRATFAPGASFSPQLGNTVYNPRWAVNNKVKLVTGQVAASKVLGMMLFDVREYDENGDPMIWKRDKWYEKSAVPSGYPIPVVRRGIFRIGDFVNPTGAGQQAQFGMSVVSASGGQLTVGAEALTKQQGRLGQFLGPVDEHGFALIALDI